MPYLGDLSLYEDLAAGSSLTYTDASDGLRKTISGVYASDEPLVLIGTSAAPIVIDGPVVTAGDVIIRGYVTGTGTLYAGRNVHIIGDIRYLDPPFWPSLERHQTTGQLRAYDNPWGPSDIGSVCSSGAYVSPDAGPAATRCNGQ